MPPLSAARSDPGRRVFGRRHNSDRAFKQDDAQWCDLCGYSFGSRRAIPRYGLFGRVGRKTLRQCFSFMGRSEGVTNMHGRSIMILTGSDVLTLLSGMERELIETVKAAYEAHGRAESSLPNSTFLRFPNDETSRIIALPAYLGGEFATAGIKWVSSFPGNLDHGMDRASAVILLNSVTTGRPHAMLEGSIISAKRTAASAALSARVLHEDHDASAVGVVGCGLINFE